MMDHQHFSDAEFEQQFQAGDIAFAFSHEAHLRLAWIQLRKYGLEQAKQNVSDQLMNFVRIKGAEDKFNKTLTIAAVYVVHHFMGKSTNDHFEAFIKEFPRLNSHFKDLVMTHYQIDIFNNQEAKRVYLEPDLLPFV